MSDLSFGTVISSKKRQKRSEAWDYFEIVGNSLESSKKIVKCKCMKTLEYTPSQGTSSMMKHLRVCKHYQQIYSNGQSLIVHGLEGISCMNSKYDEDYSQRALEELFIVEELPFVLVTSTWFRRFTKSLNPKFNICPNQTLATKIKARVESMSIEIKRLIAEEKNGRFSYTYDIWTSNQNLAYMCVSIHFIDSKFKLKSFLIGFEVLPGHYTGENIANTFVKITQDCGSFEKSLCLVTDNALINDTACQCINNTVTELKIPPFPHQWDIFRGRCMTQILNLVVKDGLEIIEPAIEKIRDFAKLLSSSPLNYELFKDFVARQYPDVGSLKNLILDVKTRWNSTYAMLQMALPLKNPISSWLVEKNDALILSPTDWSDAESFIAMLEPFHTSMLMLSGKDHPTIHCGYLVISVLKKHINACKRNSNIVVKNAAIAMESKFSKYFEEIPTSVIIAHILDPRYKLELIGSESIVKKAEYLEKFKSFLGPLENTEEDATTSFRAMTSSHNSNTLSGLVDPFKSLAMSLATRTTNSNAQRKTELEEYLEAPLQTHEDNFDILEWWRVHKHLYPRLAGLARDILAIPASSVPSESAFSNAGRVLDDYRSCLSPTTVRCLLLGESWLKKGLNKNQETNEAIVIDD